MVVYYFLKSQGEKSAQDRFILKIKLKIMK